MSTAAHEVSPTRAAIAEEVRAAMARARINPTQLARMTGKSQTYWWRRVVSVETPLDVDDLAVVAEILHVSIRDLIPDDEDPRPGVSQGGGQGVVRHQGLEPRTRWLMSVPPIEHGAVVLDLDAHRRPEAA